MENNSSGKIQSIVRASEILQCCADAPALGITEIAKRVGLHKSTVYGLVSTLVSCGLLQQNPDTGKYSIGIQLFRLGQCFNLSIGQVMLPYLTDLLNEFQETVNFVIREGNEVIYIEKLESQRSMRIRTYRGMRLPLYCTGGGKAILAFLPEDEQRRIAEDTCFVRNTEHTLMTKEALLQELETIRLNGYALDNEEHEYSVFCVAVPILDRDRRPFGAISISCPRGRVTAELQARIARRLQESAAAISAELWGCNLQSDEYNY